jgi:hypothetical protein
MTCGHLTSIYMCGACVCSTIQTLLLNLNYCVELSCVLLDYLMPFKSYLLLY